MKQSGNQGVPQHLAIIMDGNRRWARERGLPVLEGHRRVSTRVLEKLIAHAAGIGVEYLTFWAFSTENWKRDTEEVTGIMTIFRHGLKTMGMKMHKKGVRIKMIGDMTKFPQDIQDDLQHFIKLTQNNTAITVVFALNYGGRDEIIRAIQRLGTTNNVTIKQFSNYLDTAGIPDPNMVVRTGGEERTSGFLLWQSEYSEWMFPRWYMPDFTPERHDEVIEEFRQRQRRFGT